MALGATIYKVQLNVSDLTRHHYGDYALTLARHPSETQVRLMTRLLAFAAHADPALTFTKGLSTDDEAELWQHSDDGRITLWIELGEPTVKRIKQALARAEQVVVYSYGGRAAEQWFKQQGKELQALGSRLQIWHLPYEQLPALAALAARSLNLAATLMEGEWLLTDGQHSAQVQLQRWH
ncbi:YaeQ family protein [Gallaecimonas sp. GXIMD1310]|uniref:YaeQ family protein n=1 Tax=Gallaecimonas sp. GXIMD1310 TaxID=3131926 RepID=UPI00324C2FB2